MPGFSVLVCAPRWAADAQQYLQQAGGHVEFIAEPVTASNLVARLAAGCFEAIILRGSWPLTTRVLDAAPALKIIAKNGAGVDSVDLAAARQRGITLAVAAGANADAVAEHASALMLALTRDLHRLDRAVRQARWAGTAHQGRDFRGSVVGIVGYGSIGRSTARLAAALGAQVVVLRRSAAADAFEVKADLDRLAARIDILSLHIPLTEQTRGLIGRRELALLKPGPCSSIPRAGRRRLCSQQELPNASSPSSSQVTEKPAPAGDTPGVDPGQLQ